MDLLIRLAAAALLLTGCPSRPDATPSTTSAENPGPTETSRTPDAGRPTETGDTPRTHDADMTTPPSPAQVTFEGETVTISVVGEFRVGHGRFRLRNTGSDAAVVSVRDVWFASDGQRKKLALGSVHDVARGENLDAEALQLAPGDDRAVLIAFPMFSHEPRLSEQSAVVVRIRLGDTSLEASSPLRFERRIPRRRP